MSEATEAFRIDEARTELLALQQRMRALNVPVVIFLEGWDAAGKGTMAGELLEGLDPRGYDVHVAERSQPEADEYPALRRWWVRMPKQGKLSLFIGSPYHELCKAAVRGKEHRFISGLESVANMERMLLCDGVLLLKFFLHIPQKEQKRRLKALAADRLTRGRVTKADLRQNEEYDKWRAAYDRVLSTANAGGAPWQVIRAEDKAEARRRIYQAVASAFAQTIALRESGDRSWDVPALPVDHPIPVAPIAPLSDYAPYQEVDGDYKTLLDEKQKHLRKLQYELHKRKIPMVLAFEGWDAAGKGGAIRRLTAALDVRGFTVVPIASPTAEEKAHHHLWRFWQTLPRRGDIVIYDRTWYGRVMVERLEGFCTEPQWNRAYEELNLFERDLWESGAIVRKFWLQIDQDEQLKRFIARRDDPQKQWKITDEDWRNREKWPLYEAAVNEMLQKTHTPQAPWTVIEANNKHYARLKVLDVVIAAIEERLE